MRKSKRTQSEFLLARALWRTARALYDNEVARERDYAARDYQIKAAVRAVLLALKGANSAIELPTGTGKTLIACIAAVLWHSQRPASRILLIVPSRTLVVQHFDVARWVSTALRVNRVTDAHSGDPGALRHTLVRNEFIVSTPGMLASALARGAIDEEVIASIDFVIADEFDQFVVVDEEDRDGVARYAEHWDRLLTRLPEKARYLVKSATLGVDTKPGAVAAQRRADKRAHLIRDRLAPISIVIPERQYAAVVPFQRILPIAIDDDRVRRLLSAVSVAKGQAHLRLDQVLGPTNYLDVERRAPSLCTSALGRDVQLRGLGGPLRFKLTAPARQGFCSITSLMMMPQHLIEDLTLGFDTKPTSGQVAIKTVRNETAFLTEALALIDKRPDTHFYFQKGAKTDALLAILNERKRLKHRGVVFVRTLTLLEGLAPLLETAGHKLHFLTGEMDDDARKASIAGFRKSRAGLLVMTRTTGGRGLDLPFADYSIFYSPKTDPVTMWQEMSRTRSTVSNPKSTYVLCYPGESDTLLNVIEALLQQNRRVSIE